MRNALVALAVAVLAVQVVRPAHTNPPVEANLVAPPEVGAILRRACWDCHSNETVWGWHTFVAPVSWLAVHDVNEGRQDLNFSLREPSRRPGRMGAKIADQVAEGEMPPLLYVLAHPSARLSDGDRATLLRWARMIPGGARAERDPQR